MKRSSLASQKKSQKHSKGFAKEALVLHKKNQGKLTMQSLVPVKNKEDLSIVYTPGVAAVSLAIAHNKDLANSLTMKGRTVAIISDGSAVLGLGNIGPEAALPVMEGKAILFKELAGVDAIPLVIDVHTVDEIVATVKALAPGFGGINLEDIAAPQCFEIEERLKKELDIPVLHDDQHGTALVVLAGLINALKVVNKKADNCVAVVSGVGAAGIAIMRLIKEFAPKITVYAVDSKGVVNKKSVLNSAKVKLIKDKIITTNKTGTLADVLQRADIFIGVSQPGVVTKDMIKTMDKKAIIFAMANPVPEILPDQALAAGATVVATGRSDFDNQINNSLGFPGIFKGALQNQVQDITSTMLIKAARNLAACVAKPTATHIIPSSFDKGVVDAVAKAIKK
jgi:malate dehydrogenase (oxaloacetate-decarboxylating)